LVWLNEKLTGRDLRKHFPNNEGSTAAQNYSLKHEGYIRGKAKQLLLNVKYRFKADRDGNF